jgi:hypothetical protein
LDVVKYLIENGADIHAKNDAALHHAVYRCHLNIVKYLIENGVDINKLNKNKNSKIKEFVKSIKNDILVINFSIVYYLKGLKSFSTI